MLDVNVEVERGVKEACGVKFPWLRPPGRYKRGYGTTFELSVLVSSVCMVMLYPGCRVGWGPGRMTSEKKGGTPVAGGC